MNSTSESSLAMSEQSSVVKTGPPSLLRATTTTVVDVVVDSSGDGSYCCVGDGEGMESAADNGGGETS